MDKTHGGRRPNSGRKPSTPKDPIDRKRAFYLRRSQVEAGITGEQVREAVDLLPKKSVKLESLNPGDKFRLSPNGQDFKFLGPGLPYTPVSHAKVEFATNSDWPDWLGIYLPLFLQVYKV